MLASGATDGQQLNSDKHDRKTQKLDQANIKASKDQQDSQQINPE